MTDAQTLGAFVGLQFGCALGIALWLNRYAIRRWLWSWLWYFDPVAVKVAAWCRRVKRCMGCGVKLTPDEHEHYGHSCNACEARWMERWDDCE